MTKQSYSHFCRKNNIHVVIKWIEENEDLFSREVNMYTAETRNWTNWQVSLVAVPPNHLDLFQFNFSHTNEACPDINRALHALAKEVATYENTQGRFMDWCDEYIYDPEDDEAKQSFDIIRKHRTQLKAFLDKIDPDCFETFLWETDKPEKQDYPFEAQEFPSHTDVRCYARRTSLDDQIPYMSEEFKDVYWKPCEKCDSETTYKLGKR